MNNRPLAAYDLGGEMYSADLANPKIWRIDSYS